MLGRSAVIAGSVNETKTIAERMLTSIGLPTVNVWHDAKLGAVLPRAVSLTQLRRGYSMIDRELDRDNDRLRVLIETIVC